MIGLMDILRLLAMVGCIWCLGYVCYLVYKCFRKTKGLIIKAGSYTDRFKGDQVFECKICGCVFKTDHRYYTVEYRTSLHTRCMGCNSLLISTEQFDGVWIGR